MSARTTSSNITETIDSKIAALRAHRSQTAHMTGLDGRTRAWGADLARPHRLPEGRFAEALQVVPLG